MVVLKQVQLNMVALLMLPVIISFRITMYLLDKPCLYVWGNCDVTIEDPLSEIEYIILRMSPIVMAILVLVIALAIG